MTDGPPAMAAPGPDAADEGSTLVRYSVGFGDGGDLDSGLTRASDGGSLVVGSSASPGALEASVADEPPYAPGARRRNKGGVAASSEEDDVAKWNRGGPDVAASSNAKAPHPAPRVKVDVVQVRGKIQEADVLRLARSKGYWPFRLCFEDGLRRTPKLHGKVRFRVAVGSGGAVRGVHKVASELEDADVVSCVLKAARKVVLSSPERGTPDVTLEVSFWPGDTPVPGASLPPASPRVPDAVLTSLRARWEDVRTCYASGLLRTPELWGRLALKLRVAASGRIVEASEVESRFPDQDVAECVLEAYERAGLSPSSEERVIVYPLRLGAPAP